MTDKRQKIHALLSNFLDRYNGYFIYSTSGFEKMFWAKIHDDLTTLSFKIDEIMENNNDI